MAEERPHKKTAPAMTATTARAQDYGVWVYAVAGGIEREWLAGMTGVGGQPVRALEAGGLAAAVTAVSLGEFGAEPLRHHLEDLAWLEAKARMHHRVIEAVARHGPAVPMRLATIYHDDAGVAAMLAARQADFSAALRRVTERTEWGVKVFAAHRFDDAAAGGSGPSGAAAGGAARGGAAAAAPGGAATPGGTARRGAATGGAAGGPGAAYLRRRREELSGAEAARRAAVASADDVHAVLARLAAAAQLRIPQSHQLSGQPGQMVLNAAYLIDDQRSGDFAATVQQLAGRHRGVRIEVTGPWPPYSFATVAERAAGAPAAAERGRGA